MARRPISTSATPMAATTMATMSAASHGGSTMASARIAAASSARTAAKSTTPPATSIARPAPIRPTWSLISALARATSWRKRREVSRVRSPKRAPMPRSRSEATIGSPGAAIQRSMGSAAGTRVTSRPSTKPAATAAAKKTRAGAAPRLRPRQRTGARFAGAPCRQSFRLLGGTAGLARQSAPPSAAKESAPWRSARANPLRHGGEAFLLALQEGVGGAAHVVGKADGGAARASRRPRPSRILGLEAAAPMPLIVSCLRPCHPSLPPIRDLPAPLPDRRRR